MGSRSQCRGMVAQNISTLGHSLNERSQFRKFARKELHKPESDHVFPVITVSLCEDYLPQFYTDLTSGGVASNFHSTKIERVKLSVCSSRNEARISAIRRIIAQFRNVTALIRTRHVSLKIVMWFNWIIQLEGQLLAICKIHSCSLRRKIDRPKPCS